MKGICILGSTGSIGASTLDVVSRHPERFRVVALTAHQDADRLAEQCRRHRPRYAVMADSDAAVRLRAQLSGTELPTEVLAGAAELESVASLPEVDYVMAAIVGAAGLMPTLAAANSGKRLLLANKEALVVAGEVLMSAVAGSGATLLPIDSEHNAVFQCLPPGYQRGLAAVGVERILLTASGGPFRDLQPTELSEVTPDQAVAHPNWSMGKKISVDSATMMNKGLELIEACWLFSTSPDRVQVVVHPQSVIHSLVQYVDGSVLAQLGNPDMRTPIAHALAWPERMASGVAPLDLFRVGHLDFSAPGTDRFPCLRLAAQSAEVGGTAPAVLNAANEIAVAAFLDGRIRFTDIASLVETTLERIPVEPVDGSGLHHLLQVDRQARAVAEQCLTGCVR